MRILATIITTLLLALTPVQAENGFTMEGFFKGKTYAKGIFKQTINGESRAFDLILNGAWDNKTLTLTEDFYYEDGERDRKTWRFTKIGKGQYVGTRDDVIGETKVTIIGNKAQFKYNILFPRKNKKPIKLHFKDTLILQKNGILQNTAKVSKFGLPVAKVLVYFARPSNRHLIPKPSL